MMREAGQRQIPIFMVRLGFGRPLGEVTYDGLWKSAVEQTGGRFYAVADERGLLQAVSDIDRLAVGRIAEQRSAAAVPAFGGYAVIAVALWLTAGTLKLGLPFFRTFP
jgi:hypothetical protein